jgi:DNA modification methylase
VLFVNSPIIGAERHGRKIAYEQFSPSTTENSYAEFQESSYFRRFIVDRKSSAEPTIVEVPSKFPGISVFHGDCFEVLSAMAADSVDGAVTSPPYYNARSYSEWPNIYSYLYDMYNSARQVFRVLKPGSCYLFNIFDYFDNENNIVLSAMGKKRMILGAYIINLFRRIGFTLLGNVVWYKGEIEGKRNFNQGNRSPYYQFPFNCWEHVLVFRKPDGEVSTYSFPTILAAKPVMKMFNGENKLGHSAPFPSAIPDLLLSQLPPGAIVLDPFSGSMTTGRSATRLGISSISIEKHKEYCELGLRLLEGETPALFQSVLS